MSKRSSSPHLRKSISNPEPYLSNLKDSTNVPLTSFLSSDENYAQFDEEENLILEELNELYQVFIGWVFSSKSELECSRSIKYKNIIPLCLNLAAKSTKLMKQKVIADFHFMTAVEKNASVIMGERTFGRWILDLMYTVFPPKADFEKDPIWDMGCKLYIQMNKICFNTDADAHNYIHQLIVWPINKYLRQKSTLERFKNDIKKKERMIRTILFSFLDTISADKEREYWTPSLTAKTPYLKFWNNLIYVVFYIEELVLSYSSAFQSINDDKSTPYKKSEVTFFQEYTASLLENGYECSFYSELNKQLFLSTKNKWQDSKLIDTIFEIIEPIWYIKAKRRSSKAKRSTTPGYGKLGYIQIEDQVLDCLDEISSNDANEKITILLSKKIYTEEGKSNKKDKYNFNLLKTIISLIWIRITIEKNKNVLTYYCKMLRDLSECLVYISENWVSQKSEQIREIQIKLSRAIGYIIYFLHQEIRCSEGDTKDLLHDVLNSLMATIFVIVLKKYPKDHEHAPIDTADAKVISLVLNGFFEKPDETLLFIRKDIENYQAKDYKGVSTYLTSDQCHDFFEESSRFENVRKEF